MKKRSSVFPIWLLLTITLSVIVLVLLLYFIFQLNSEKTAKGYEDEIFVVADSAEYEQIKKSLQSTFEKEIFTPQPEKLFQLKRINPSQLDTMKQTKSIIIAAPLNSEGKTSQLINSVVDSSDKTKLSADSEYVAYKQDLWAKNQLVSVLSAPTTEELNSKILRNSGNLLNAYQEQSDERLLSNLYNPADEQTKIEGKFLKEYGWVIYVQADSRIVINNSEDKFVWLKSTSGSDLEKSFFIYWIDNASPDYLTSDSIKVLRDRLTKKYYRSVNDTSFVEVSADNFVVNEVDFNGRYALFTQGLWADDGKEMSGPFVNYFFYDEKTKRIYMIDGSVNAPKYYKRNLIQQIDVTLQSFRTAAELNSERKEELLDAIDN